MRTKTIVTAFAAAAAVTVVAAPAASASGINPGNCPAGAFCLWTFYNYPDTTDPGPPALATYGEWSGTVAGTLTFYNGTSNIFYGPVTVTGVTWRDGKTC